MSKRIVCWIGEAPNHRALAVKIAADHRIAGIVIDRKRKAGNSSRGPRQMLSKMIGKLRFGSIDRAWKKLQRYYATQFPKYPEAELLYVDSINSPEALAFTKKLTPDLIIVSGTGLIREPMSSLPLPVGIINLHTGLSPYVKGGPNCTNWCIANGQWGLVGNTVFWLSAGIDSGNIITSERTDLNGRQDLYSIHLAVMEHAHQLYLKAIDYILEGKTPLQSVPQSELGKGNLYLTRMWTGKKKKALLRNLRDQRRESSANDVKTVALP